MRLGLKEKKVCHQKSMHKPAYFCNSRLTLSQLHNCIMATRPLSEMMTMADQVYTNRPGHNRPQNSIMAVRLLFEMVSTAHHVYFCSVTRCLCSLK